MEAYLERHLDFKIFPLDAGVNRDAILRPAHHILREMFDRVGVLESGEKNSHELLKNHWRKVKPKNSELIWLDQILEFPHVTETESIWLD